MGSPAPCYGKTMLAIDVYSDVVCPWCYLGTERLAQTLDAMGIAGETSVHYRPFLLSPDTPPEGVNIHERLKRRYGDLRVLLQRVEGAARDSGHRARFVEATHELPHPARAHTLLRHADKRGTQREHGTRAVPRLLRRRSAHISDSFTVLADVASQHGFDADEVVGLVKANRASFRSPRAAKQQAAAERGITGVPLFVFGERYTVSGAQSVAVLRSVIQKAQATS